MLPNEPPYDPFFLRLPLAGPKERLREVRIAKEYLDKISALGKDVVRQDHRDRQGLYDYLDCVEYWRRLLTLIMEQINEKEDGQLRLKSVELARYIMEHLFQLFPLLVLLDELFKEGCDLDLMGSSNPTRYFQGHTREMVLKYCADFGADAAEKDLGVGKGDLRRLTDLGKLPQDGLRQGSYLRSVSRRTWQFAKSVFTVSR